MVFVRVVFHKILPLQSIGSRIPEGRGAIAPQQLLINPVTTAHRLEQSALDTEQ